MSKLTARDFAKFEWAKLIYAKHPIKIKGIDDFEAGFVLLEGSAYSCNVDNLRPILRPTEDMTEEEGKEFNSLMEVETFYSPAGFTYGTYEKPTAACYDYLDSRQLDVRGLIGEGLAVSRHEFPDLRYSFEQGGNHD